MQYQYDQQTNQQQNNGNKQSNNTEFYQLLEVAKDATAQQIRKAFRKKALKQHPDKGGDPAKFSRLKQVYQILTNPQKRQLYDQYGQEGVKNGGPPGQNQGFGDLYNFFNKKDTGPKKTKPKLIQLEVTLQEIFTGVMKKINIKRYRVCKDCQGLGGKNATKCQDCQGVGIVIKMVQLGMGMYTQAQVHCQKCRGMGSMFKEQDQCKVCQGKKISQNEAVIEVAIQPGCPDFHDYILTGESDQYPGYLAGDIYARVKIQPHKIFQRKGADLTYIRQITLLEALTGVTFLIPHLDGTQHLIATSPNQILSNKIVKTAKKLGLPFYKDSMSYGNLHVEFIIKFPQDNALTGQHIQQLIKILSPLYSNNQQQNNKNIDKDYCFQLQQYSDELLNKSPKGKQQQQQHQQVQQQISCQQQ